MMVLVRWLKGFGRFWYGFIIGDDWTVAAALLVTWLLQTAAVAAWWLPPVAAVVAIRASLSPTGPGPDRVADAWTTSVFRSYLRVSLQGRRRCA
jgi:hypothetical protein